MSSQDTNIWVAGLIASHICTSITLLLLTAGNQNVH